MEIIWDNIIQILFFNMVIETMIEIISVLT
jgi:hypothetical protein